MNVLFIFSRHATDPRDSTLTKDLSDAFAASGANVYVMTMLEERYNQPTKMSLENGYNVLRVRTGNYFNCETKLEKVRTIVTLPKKFVSAAQIHLKDVHIDLVIAHTPFMSSRKIILPLKKYFNCPAHLILWDIFPQNAWDIGILKNRFLYKVLKYFEIKMLSSYEQIWCMSDGNVNYLRRYYPQLSSVDINKLYNSAIIKPLPNIDRVFVRSKFGYSNDDVVAIFGGNMGIPQCLENILKLARVAQSELIHAKFLFIGKGTETSRLIVLANSMKLKNVQFIDQLAREDYENITAAADIGLVSLDPRFTVPNFPSKTTDYFKLGLPILASLDKCAAEDYGYFLTDIVKAGMFAIAGDDKVFFERYFDLYSNRDLRVQLGRSGRKFYESELDSFKACDIISSKFGRSCNV